MHGQVDTSADPAKCDIHHPPVARALARRSADAPEWQRNREVQRLTREILALQAEAAAKVVAAIVAMGLRMRQVRAAFGP